MTGPGRTFGFCLMLVFAFSHTAELSAQDSALPAFRRVFVPQEALATQLNRLLPMNRDEFERRAQEAQARQGVTMRPPTARLEEASFRARLAGRRLDDGSARLSIVVPNGAGPALIPLAPCNLAVTDAHWVKTGEPALVGADADGQLQCLVKESGELELAWSLAARTSADDAIDFALKLPVAPRRRLEIECEGNTELTLEGGVSSLRQAASSMLGTEKWMFKLPGSGQVILQSRSRTVKPSRAPSLQVRESSYYTLWPSSLDLETTLVCEALDGDPRQLHLQLEPPLLPIAVQLDDRQVPWELRESDQPAGGQILTVNVSQSDAQRHTIHVTAAAAWSLSGLKALPRIQIADALLQDARREIQAPEWMQMVARPLGSCIQVQAVAAAGGRPVERFAFHAYAPDGGIEIESAPPNLPLEERSGTQIIVDGNQVVGVLVAELHGRGREIFDLEAEVPRQWIVDSVETVPPNILADRAIAARGAGPQRLQVKLAQPIVSGRSLRLVVRGHFRRPAGRELRGTSVFQLARFPAVGTSRRLISVRVSDPGLELSVHGDESLVRHSADELTTDDRELFESPPTGLVFESAAGVEDLTASLKSAKASYRADVAIRVDADKNASQQTATLHCTPEGTTIGAVVVRMAPRPRSAVRWQLIGDGTPRELTATVEGDAVNDEAITYRLALPRAFSAPLEIRGQWSPAATGQLSLLWLPEASRQISIVEIHSPIPGVEIERQALTALPLPTNARDAKSCVARFSYEVGQQARCTVRFSSAAKSTPDAWIESLHVSSHIAGTGRVENEAELIVRDAATDRLMVQLPEGIKECHLSSDGHDERLLPIDAGVLQVPLAVGQDSQRVVLRYLSPIAAPAYWPLWQFTLPLPQTSAPVLAQSWSASLAPGLAPVALDEHWRGERFPPQIAPITGERESPARARSNWLNLAKRLGGLELLPKSGWLKLPSGARSPRAAFRDWQVFSRALHKSEAISITVFRVPDLLVWSFALVMALTPLGWRLARLPAWLFTATVLLTALALVLHPPWSWLALGAVLGLVLGFTIRHVHTQPISHSRQTTLRWAASQSVACLLLGLIFIDGTRHIQAAPPPIDESLPRAVYPVDQNLQPRGDYVYLTPELYEAVHRLPTTGSEPQPAWLIQSAHYRLGPLASFPADTSAIVHLQASVRLHVLRANTLVRLPLRRQELLLQPDSVRLDGAKATLTWDDAGQALLIPTPAVGEHRLELALVGAARRIGDVMTLDAGIPPAAMTTVEIPQHVAVQGLQINGLEATKAASSQSSSLALGNTHQLMMRWPSLSTPTPTASVEVEQLAWWRIRPASVVLEVQLRLQSLGEPVRSVPLTVDPRLRPLPSLTTGDVGRIVVDDEAKGRMSIEIPESADEPKLRLGWLWHDAPTLGALVLPQVRVDGFVVSRHWTAVSLEGGVSLGNMEGGASRIEPAEFARVWGGDSSLQPAVAVAQLATSSSADRLQVTVQPAAAEMQVRQTADWTISRSSVTVEARYELTDVPPSRFDHRLDFPPAITISGVRLEQGERLSAIRWRQEPEGQLRITLLEPPTPSATLSIAASLGVRPAVNQLELPVWSLEEAHISDTRIRIFRHADTKLTLAGHAGWSPAINASDIEPEVHSARRFSSLQADHPAAAKGPIVRREANRPRMTGTQTTTVMEADGDWQAEAAWKLQIADGTLDHLRLYVPADWPEPLALEPAWKYRSDPSASEGRRLITIFPPREVRDRLELKLRGPLSVSTGAIEAPAIHLLDADKLQQRLLLDGGSAHQPIEWETRGLVPMNKQQADNKQQDDEFVAAPDRLNVFRVVNERFRAVARMQSVTGRVPQIAEMRLDTRLVSSGRAIITAQFTIVPESLAELAFELPPQSRLIQVRADDLPLVTTQTGVRRWTVSSLSNILPFQLTIIYDEAWSLTSSNPTALLAPRLLDFNPVPAIWTIHNPNEETGDSLVMERAGVRQCSPAEQHVARLEGIGRALDAVQTARSAALPGSVLAEAFYRWNDQLQAMLSSEPSSLADDVQVGEFVARQKAVASQAASVYQRLVQAGILEEDSPETTRAAAPSIGAPQNKQLFVVSDPANGLFLGHTPATSSPPPWRAVIAICLAIAALAGPPLGRVLHVERSPIARPMFASVLVGVCWWILAPLGWLGWLFAGLGLCLGLRPRKQRSNSGGSTIQRYPA